LLEKKIEKAIRIVNQMMAAEEIRLSDQGKDAVKSVLKGCTSFENTFDKIIEAGKKEVDEIQPKNGTKISIPLPEGRLVKEYA